jgi:hypothetical protein
MTRGAARGILAPPAATRVGRQVIGLWCVMQSCLVVACDDGRPPTAPSPPPSLQPDWANLPLAISDERYSLEITGADAVGDPSLPPCSPPNTPPGGKSVNTFVWFARDGDEFVGRSRPPYGATIEMRLRRVGSSILGVAIAGTVTGSVVDEYDRFLGKRNAVFNAYSPVSLEGTTAPRAATDRRGSALGGLLRGQIGFNDSAGWASFCTSVRFHLEPAPPGGPHDDTSVPPLVPGPTPVSGGHAPVP